MAYGSVNAPGVSASELAAVENTANQALSAAGAAQDDATAALEMLETMLGGTMPSTTLANNTPEVIKAVASLGLGAHFWNIGDRLPIQLNGTVGNLTLNSSYYAFIIGFNHNGSLEAGNSIHFQFGKDSTGKDICFIDSKYAPDNGWSSAGAGYLVMNTTYTNVGGWRDSYMRSTICPAFLAAMPSAWREVIADCAKYTDNVGNGNGHVASQISSTVDKIWLLGYLEVFANNDGEYCNNYEAGYTKQYAYYANGNSRVKYKHSATGSAARWWLRSPYYDDNDYFCFVSTDGTSYDTDANYSLGFAPGFVVA